MLGACIKISVAILRRIFAQALTHESRELAKKVKIFRNIYYVRRFDQLSCTLVNYYDFFAWSTHLWPTDTSMQLTFHFTTLQVRTGGVE